MAISVKHAFQSSKGDGVDTTVVRPSNWNAAHTLLMATARLLGRATAGTGAVEELSLGADLTMSGGTLTIPNDAITYAKLQNITATSRLLGRFTAAAGDAEEIALGAGVSVAGGTLTVEPNLPRGYIDGCTMSNGTDAVNDLNFAEGVCRDSTNTQNINVVAMSGKQLDANFAVGAAAGMRNSAVGIANGVYHIWAARTAASATADFYAHTSTVPATVLAALQLEAGGASYAYLRRIGSIVRSGATILAFKQIGDQFDWKTFRAESPANRTTAAANITLTVPTGINVRAQIFAVSGDTDGDYVYLYSPNIDDAAVDVAVNISFAANSAGSRMPVELHIWTNTSAQIRGVCNSASTVISISTKGYLDLRGKDA